MPINAKELAIKLFVNCPVWSEIPLVLVTGNEKEFGQIIFSFPDEAVIINAYLFDKNKIIEMAKEAVEKFSKLLQEYRNDHLYDD